MGYTTQQRLYMSLRVAALRNKHSSKVMLTGPHALYHINRSVSVQTPKKKMSHNCRLHKVCCESSSVLSDA